MLVRSGLSKGARMAFTSEGVGVRGGALDFVAVRLLLGVEGKAGFLKLASSGSMGASADLRAFLDGVSRVVPFVALRFWT